VVGFFTEILFLEKKIGHISRVSSPKIKDKSNWIAGDQGGQPLNYLMHDPGICILNQPKTVKKHLYSFFKFILFKLKKQ
jgi:hypothetical protein